MHKNSKLLICLAIIQFLPGFFRITQADNRIDSLMSLLPGSGIKKQAQIYFHISLIYYNTDSLNMSLQFAKKSEQLASEIHDEELVITIKNQLGYIFLSWDDYDKALSYFLSALTKAQELANDKGLLTAYHGLGRTYTRLKDYELAKESLENALEYARKGKMKRERAIMNNALGNLFQETGEYDKALKHLELFYNISKEIGDKTSVVYALNNIGGVYNMTGKNEMAIRYFQLALKYNENINDAQAQAASLGNLGEVYSKLGKYQLADSCIRQSNIISKQQGFRLFTDDNYKLLSDNYSRSGNYKLALEYYEKYTALKDSIFSDNKQSQIQKLKLKYETEKNERKIKQLEQESRNRGIFLRFTIFTSILGIIVIVLLYIAYRLRLKLHKQEKQKLDQTLDQRNRELVTLRMDSAQKRNFLKEIESSVEEFDEYEKKEINDFVDRLKSKLKSEKLPEEEWNTLKTHFENVHPDFFKKLTLKHPSLSQNELKVCAYIKMNLTTKNIARMLNINIRSVQTARYRIKKKMQLEAEEDLFKYIQQL